jgi:hypothetical protein
VSELLERAIEAHGGRDAWHGRTGFEIELNVGGAAWPLRLRRAPGRLLGRVRTAEPWTEFVDFPAPGSRGVFEGDNVRIEADGRVTDVRHDPRAAFKRLRQHFRWDDLDFLYFSGYALWNYMAFPFMLERPGVELEERPDRVLAARFPDEFPTHSPEQLFYLDDAYRLVRHDYTALAFGGWAKGAHLTSQHAQLAGLTVPTRRRVYPRLPGGRVAPAPVIVAIDIVTVRALA